ncbi:hypothetical protein [Paludibacterium denitrificans]|uniref:Uncharacterized protein n=1 Tax=Paludibacterium denitrificans TaxID=2675226 RepID=A0A844GDA7_9NEIS|nr:hypothetical protein [Paludibacterium denitrificans]MTD33752.1 hypothetical protein [Paludibacterium denitrificans]
MNFNEGRLSQLISSAGHVVDISHDTVYRIAAVALRDPVSGEAGRVLARYRYSDSNPLLTDA